MERLDIMRNEIGVKQCAILVRLLFAILLNIQIYNATVTAQLSFPSSNLTDDYARFENEESKLPICNLTVNPRDAILFSNRLSHQDVNFAYLHLEFPDTVVIKYADDVFLPFTWVWTRKAPGGGYPFLTYEYDAWILSAGLLNVYTLQNVSLRLEPHQQNCSLTLRTNDTYRAIGQALGNMVLDHFSDSLRRNNSAICDIDKLDSFSAGQSVFDIYTFLGYWQDPTAYRCCEVYSDDKSDGLKIMCGDKKITVNGWITVFYIVSFICFMYLPIPLSCLCDYISVVIRNVTATKTQDSTEFSAMGNDNTVGNLTIAKEDWMYLGIDNPATLVCFIDKVFKCIMKKHPDFCPRLPIFLLFVLIIPLPLIIEVICYRAIDSFTTIHRIKAGIAVGFLSIPYGSQNIASDWMTVFGVPYMMVVLYVLFVFIVCLPRNISDFLFDAVQGEDDSENCCANYCKKCCNKCCCPMSITELYYTRGIQKEEARLFSLLKANVCRFTPSFWKFYFYYGCPFVFCWFNVFRATFHKCLSFSTTRMCGAIIALCLLPFGTYAYFLIFIRGCQISLLFILYCYIGIVINPQKALGVVTGITAGFVYLGRRWRQFTDSYLSLLDETVEINKEMEKATGEILATVTEKAIVLNHVDGIDIETLDIDGTKITFTEEQRQLLNVRSADYVTEVPNRTKSKYIRWQGNNPGIPSKLFDYVVQKHHHLGEAFVVFVVKFFLFIAIVVSLLCLAKTFSYASNFLPLVNAFNVVLLTLFPSLVEIVKSKKDTKIQAKIFRDKLKLTVKNFYKEKENDDHSNQTEI